MPVEPTETLQSNTPAEGATDDALVEAQGHLEGDMADPASEATSDLENAQDATARLCERVASMRSQRGWTLQQMAERSGVSRSMLSQIERNEANPTFAVAYRIAQAFGISLGELVDDPPQGPTIEVVRANARPLDAIDDEKTLRGLHPLHLQRDVECYELCLKQGGDFASQPHLPGTHEFVVVSKGHVEVRSGRESTVLETGDSAYYPADVDHVLLNVGRGEAKVFLVALYSQALS